MRTWLGASSRVALPERKNRVELVEGDLVVGLGIAARGLADVHRRLGVVLDPPVAGREIAFGRDQRVGDDAPAIRPLVSGCFMLRDL